MNEYHILGTMRGRAQPPPDAAAMQAFHEAWLREVDNDANDQDATINGSDDEKSDDQSVDLQWRPAEDENDGDGDYPGHCRRYVVRRCFAGHTPEAAQAWLTGLCQSLRRNDADITGILPPSTCPVNFYQEMGAALRDNTIVQRITLNLAEVKLNDLSDSSINDLLHFLRSSPALQETTIKDSVRKNDLELEEDGDEEVADVYSGPMARMLDALSSNPHNQLKVLKLDDHKNFPFDGLAHMLRVTASLEWLKLELCQDHDVTSIDNLARGLGENETLQRFELRVGADFTSDVVSPLIRQMRLNKKLPLQHLQLDMSGSDSDRRLAAQFQELSLLLVTPPALCVLAQLEFVQIWFKKEEMQYLVRGLLASRSVTGLSFVDCDFDLAAGFFFERFMQTPISDVPHNVLRELDMRSTFDGAARILVNQRADFDEESGDYPYPYDVEEVLPIVATGGTSNEEISPTIGRSLISMTFYQIDRVGRAFFPTLAANAARIALQRLRIIELDEEMAHLDCLRNLVHLRILYLENVAIQIPQYRYLQRFAQAMEHNGSLHAVVILATETPRALSLDYVTKGYDIPPGPIRNICRRNRALVARQAEPRLWRSDAKEQCASNNHDMATTAVLHHVPRGFAIAPPPTQPSVMISCLMAYPETILGLVDASRGGNGGATGKRVRDNSDTGEEPSSQRAKTDTN